MQKETNPAEMQDFLTAQAQRRSVYLADRRLMVNTTLTRAKDIRFAVDMELDKQSRDNYFALTQMDQSVPDMTRGILGQAAKGVAGTGTDLFLTMQRLTAAGLSSAGRYVQKQRELSAASADFLAGRTTAAQTNERYQQIEAKYNELTRLGRNALDIMKQNHQAFMERAGLAKDEKDGFVYDFASGLTTLGAGVGATVITGNPAAASVLFGLYAGRQDYEEALENGITPGRAMAAGLAGGTMEGALEHLGLSGLEKIFKGKGILRAGLKGFITEATQEGSQQTAEEFIMQHFGGREKSFEDTFVDIAYSALLGGLTGAPISMVMNFAQSQFEEQGLKPPEAKAFARLAVESATSQAAQKMAHDTLRDVTSPLNYPNADPVQAAQDFGQMVKTEPDRAIMRKIYNVAERMEEKALNAGFDEPTAQLLGKIEQSRANSIYNLAGIKPGSQADMAEVQFLPAAKPVDDWETQREQHQQRQAQQRAQEEAEFDRKLAEANLTDKDLLFQSAAAMYRNPARSLAEFVEFYNQNKENPKEQNKSFYRFSTASGAEVDVPFNRVKHIDKRHSFSKEQWSALERSIDNLEYAYYVPGMKGENDGVQFLCKINTPLGKAGVTLEVLPNGRVLLDTAVFDSNANIDNWAKNEPLQRPSHKKPVLVGSGIDNSIAGLQDFVKTQEMFAPDTNTLWQGGLFDNQLELFGSQAEQEDAPSPAQEDLGVEVNSLFTQEELEADLPPFKPTEKPARIEDFGEKILGARKDVWGKYKHALEEEIPSTAENVTLGKFFPEPNYDAAIRQGITADTLAAVKALRDSIPAKPQRSYRQGQWLETLKYVRALSLQLLNGQLSTQQLQQMLQQGGRAVSSLTETISFYQTLGYPLFTKARGYTMHVQNYLVYNGHRFAEPTPIYEFKRGWRSVYGSPSKEETLAFARKFFTEKAVKGAAPTKLDLYQKVRTGEIVIGKKIASGKYIDLKGGFTKVADAQKYLEENQAHLEALLEAKRKMPDVRRKINEERIGKVYRPAGTVVTPERFMQEFGFRGVQFGNWVEQERRTQDLNNAYDALLDMANLLHIPSRAVSLDGQLGLAFGARGIPGAAAHYEHKQVVINLTKTQGAGSLGHEWWHALDNYFGKTSGQDAMQTVNPSSALRPEMKAAFEEVVRVTKAVLGERSRAVDSLRSKNYWSTNSEMTARAFESYLVYKAKQLGFRNDYLANIVHPDAFLRFGQDKYPYPFDNEMPVLAAAFDNFFNTIKTRENQKGYTLYQEDADISFDFGANVSPAGARGSVSFDPQSNTAIIRAVSTSDKSTAIHELYHVWRRDLKRAEQVSSEGEFLELMQRLRDIDANSQDYVLRYISRTSLLTPSQRQIMLQTIQQRGGKKYIEALARQDELDAQDAVAMFVRRGFEENFAVLAEKYFMKGVAPSAAYKSLFDRFAQWLKEIYNAIGQEVDLAPEVQEFFDRLMVREASQVDSKLFKGKVAQLKRLVTNIRQGNAQEVDGLGIQDLKALLAQLDAPRPKAVTQHLLKDLRRFGAEYANAANIDKEAYKQARVFNKAGGVDDRPDVWLQKHGYMEFEESTEETLAAAWDMLQRALDGEIIYPQGYEEQAAQWANYKANIDTLREVFGGSEKEARKTAQAILDLEEQGYRVVEQKDLANVSLRLAELDRLAERLENKSQTTQDKEQADKDILRAAQKIKNALVKDLNKRQVEGKGEMVKRLAAAKTFKEITQAVQSTLDFLNAAWAKTPQAQQEQRRLEVPATNWDKVRRDLLAQYTRIVNSAGEDVNNAYKKVAELSKLITAGQALTDEQATALRKARQTIKNASGKMEARYVGAMESTLRQIIHITPQDARNFAARYGKNAMRFKALNEAQLDLFIKEAQATQQKNYKRYMRGKLSALFNRKAYEKLGSVRRAKYTPYMLKFLEDASKIWGGSQQEALQQYEAAVESIDPDNPPSVFQALINRVLWIKADPGGEVTMQDLHAFYEDALAAVRGDAAQKRLDGERRAVQEANIRLAACLSLKERKLPKGIVTYLLHGGVDLQTFIDIAFGQYETDMYESDPLPSRAEQSLAALKKIAAGSEEETVPGLRPDFVQYGGTPDVTFIWGDNNKGLQHIAQKHGADILPQVIDTVVAGRVERFTASKKTLVLQKGNIEAVLSLDEHGKQKTWLLTGWDATSPKGNKKRTDANGQVSTGSAATQTLPTFSRQDLGAVLNNSIAQKEPVNKGLKKHKINFREELAPETNQIKEAVFNAQINKDILRAVGTAYQLKTSQQILDKIAEMQKDTMQLTNYAYVKDQANGEVIATLFKNGKPVTYNAPRVQTINRLEALTFWIWNQNHNFVDTANGTEDFGLSGRLHYAYGQDQLKNLFDWLTPQDLQAAKNLQKLVEKHYEQESQVHQRIYGFKLPKVEFYFPSVTERVTDSIDLKQEFVQNSKSPSFIKKRVQSQRVIQRIVNPIDLVLKHLRRAGEFIFEAENYAANKRIFKDRDVESAFLEKFGQQDGKKLYSKFMALLDQQAPQKAQVKDEFYSVMNKLFNGWVKAVMGLKPITGIKQFASSVSFAENMPWGLWAKWFAEALANPRKTADFMLKASPYIQARYEMGGMNEYTARAMASDEVAPIKSRWNTFTNFMLINTRLGDKASLIFGGYPYMKYLLEVEGLSQQEAARVFEKQATRTLQSSLRVHLSQGQANADSFGTRMFLVFKNQQLQYVRKVVDAYVQFKNGEISQSKFAKTAFIYLILNPMVYTALTQGWFAADDDDREEDLKNLLTSPVSQFFGAYPFGEGVAGFFVDNAASLVSEGKLTAPRQMGLPMFDDITRDVAKGVKTVNADEVDTMEFINVFLAVAKYTGLPTQSVMNMGGGLVDIVTGKPVRGSLRAVGYTQNRAGKITGDKE